MNPEVNRPRSRITRGFTTGAGGVRRRRFAGATLVACLLGGCSSKPSGLPAIAPVSGTVTMDGQPLASATVVFESQSGHTAFGSTDAAGRYDLVAAGRSRGAIIGPNKVRIKSRTDAPPGPDWKDPIPARYNAATELSADVVAGRNTIDFPLKRDGGG